MDGSREVLLVDSTQFPEVTKVLDISVPPHGKASLLNTLAVDYERYPSLAGISLFHIGLLGPGEYNTGYLDISSYGQYLT